MKMFKIASIFGAATLALFVLGGANCGPNKCSEITKDKAACEGSVLEGGCKWTAATAPATGGTCSAKSPNPPNPPKVCTNKSVNTAGTGCVDSNCTFTAKQPATSATCRTVINGVTCPPDSSSSETCVATDWCTYTPPQDEVPASCN